MQNNQQRSSSTSTSTATRMTNADRWSDSEGEEDDLPAMRSADQKKSQKRRKSAQDPFRIWKEHFATISTIISQPSSSCNDGVRHTIDIGGSSGSSSSSGSDGNGDNSSSSASGGSSSSSSGDGGNGDNSSSSTSGGSSASSSSSSSSLNGNNNCSDNTATIGVRNSCDFNSGGGNTRRNSAESVKSNKPRSTYNDLKRKLKLKR